jgi:hypothetical protein
MRFQCYFQCQKLKNDIQNACDDETHIQTAHPKRKCNRPLSSNWSFDSAAKDRGFHRRFESVGMAVERERARAGEKLLCNLELSKMTERRRPLPGQIEFLPKARHLAAVDKMSAKPDESWKEERRGDGKTIV